jgi:hypothetical protein
VLGHFIVVGKSTGKQMIHLLLAFKIHALEVKFALFFNGIQVFKIVGPYASCA